MFLDKISQPQKNIPLILGSLIGSVVVIGAVFFSVNLFIIRSVSETNLFNLPLSASVTATNKLYSDGVISRIWPVRLALFLKGVKVVEPGGYKIPTGPESAWQIAGILGTKPYLRWVVIPEGLRKEEIADILATDLGWSDSEKSEWIDKDTETDADHTEGVYFPETYLIPADESPADVAARLRSKFEEEFAPYVTETLKQNIRWPTLIKVASLVQREAAGSQDMPLVAGIIWNRLLAGMNLDIDATLQYIKGNEIIGWWPKIIPADKAVDSPYNTYKYSGLPPHPIDNPGLSAIKAALYPAATDCLYYLHDSSGVIHCAKTYEEHQQNIEKYLK